MNDSEGMLLDIQQEVIYTRQQTGKDALDARVMSAIKQVPRHAFLPVELQHQAYANGPAPIGLGQTISQPYIVALMTDLLDCQPTDVMLEIGTGSGYQAAVLSQLVAKVYSVEVLERLAHEAETRLKALGYDNISTKNDNGYFGWPEHAPYDGIIVTAAAPHVPPALVEQLRVGAKLVIPLGTPYGYQELMLLEKTGPDSVNSRSILSVRFVPLVDCLDNPKYT